jgi:outer membrane protein assembly factor BamB
MKHLTHLCILATVALATLPVMAAQWPAWRGPNGDGIAAEGNPPTTWSETENVKWKTALPGEGQSTPVIWDNKIFIQSAVALGEEPSVEEAPNGRPMSKPATVPYRFVVLCVDRSSGAIFWERTVLEAQPHEGLHTTGSYAPYSPVTDGEKVWASFGSRGVYCFDLDGNEIWRADTAPLKMAGTFGEGSSPVLVGNALVVLADHEGDSRIFALNKDTGEKLWEQKRDEESSWSSPVAVKVGDRWEVITAASAFIRSYDAATGELIWQCSGLTGCAAPSPVVYDGKVYCTTGFQGNAILAITLGRTGDLTGTDAVSWSADKGGAIVPSPLVADGRLYVVQGYKPQLSCLDAKTGTFLYEGERLSGLQSIYASPLAAGGHIYIPDRKGVTAVLKSSDTLEVIATNTLDGVLDASPVAIGDELYLRSRTHLYCISRSG